MTEIPRDDRIDMPLPLSGDPIKFAEGGIKNLRKNRDNDYLYGWYWLI